MFLLIEVSSVSGGEKQNALVVRGNFQDVFADKLNIAGTFTVNAFESNALVDMTLQNGFRQVVGTDGRDSFDYTANGLAAISNGRFPSRAHEFQQFLWLVYAHDATLITFIHSYDFAFYGAYTTNDVNFQVSTNEVQPDHVTSIKWYAPNYIVRGTNKYKLSEYTNGYLLAELSVTRTNLVDGTPVPSQLTFIQYRTRPPDSVTMNKFLVRTPTKIHIANTNNNLPIVKVNLRGRNDVEPVEVALFTMTNIQTRDPLKSYVPQIVDKRVRVKDWRDNNMPIVTVSDGKWWIAGQLYDKRRMAAKPHRELIVMILILLSIFPIFLLSKMVRFGKANQVNNKTK